MSRKRNMKAAKGRVPRQNPRKRQGTARRSVATISHPRPLNSYEVKHTQTLRFIASAAAAGTTISFANLLNAISMATTAVAPFSVFTAVRLKKVEMWAVPILGTAVSVSSQIADTTTGIIGDFRTHTDSSMGIEPAHIAFRPSPKSEVSFFQASSGNVAFNITCPAGTVIDITCDFRNLPGTAGSAGVASVGATVGSIFYRGLDGIAIAGTNFPPPLGVAQF